MTLCMGNVPILLYYPAATANVIKVSLSSLFRHFSIFAPSFGLAQKKQKPKVARTAQRRRPCQRLPLCNSACFYFLSCGVMRIPGWFTALSLPQLAPFLPSLNSRFKSAYTLAAFHTCFFYHTTSVRLYNCNCQAAELTLNELYPYKTS